MFDFTISLACQARFGIYSLRTYKKRSDHGNEGVKSANVFQ